MSLLLAANRPCGSVVRLLLSSFLKKRARGELDEMWIKKGLKSKLVRSGC